MLVAKLGRSFLAALDLAPQVELELPRKRARRFGGHDLLRLGSVPAGVDSTKWYGQKGSLQLRFGSVCLPYARRVGLRGGAKAEAAPRDRDTDGRKE